MHTAATLLPHCLLQLLAHHASLSCHRVQQRPHRHHQFLLPIRWRGNLRRPGVSTVSGQIATASLSTVAYERQGGTDSSPAAKTGAGNYVIPAATAGSPGVLSVYVVRPRGISRSVPISGAAPWRQDLGHELRYKAFNTTCIVNGSHVSNSVATFEDYWYHQDLAAASETWSGSFQPQTVGLSASGSEFGEMATAATSFDVGGSLNH